MDEGEGDERAKAHGVTRLRWVRVGATPPANVTAPTEASAIHNRVLPLRLRP